jgi:hypothetical protein
MRRSIGLKRFMILLVGGISLVLSAAAVSESMVVVKGSKAATMDHCVAPTADMRRNHMKYLKHERDEVVHEGKRDSKFSIAECVNCHAGKDDSGHPVPVNAEGQFCDTCHHYVAVQIPCFQCHRKVPEEK